MANPLLQALKGSRSSRYALPDDYQDTPDGQSMLSTIGNTALSGLAATGNVLDLVGSSVRDVLGGENPFDQWLTPTTSANRLSGRDLLRKHGLVGQQDTWGNWAGGFAAELATDPFTWFGAGGLAKGASAGLVGASKVAKPGAGLLRFGIPLIKSSSTELLTGPTAVKIATQAGKLAERVGLSAPMRTARSLLDASVMGRLTKVGQEIAGNVFERQGKRQADVLGTTGKVGRELEQAGKTSITAGVDLRREIELGKNASPQAHALVGELNASRLRKAALGLPAAELDDEIIGSVQQNLTRLMAGQTGPIVAGGKLGYAPRRLNEEIARASAASKSPFAGRTAEDVGRLQVLKGFHKGTEGVNNLFADMGLKQKATQWTDAIDTALEQNDMKAVKRLRKAAKDDLRTHIETTFGQEIEHTFQPTNKRGEKLWLVGQKQMWAQVQPTGALPVMKDRLKGLADIALNTPKWMEHTLFPNHPLVDIEHHLVSSVNREEAAEGLYHGLTALAKTFDPASKNTTTTLRKIVRQLGFNQKVAADQLATRIGVSSADVLRMRVNKSIANDILGLWPTYQVPKATGLLANTVDSFQSLFKAGVLTWPARYVRDAMSGAVRNFENGWLDPHSFAGAHNIIQGRTVKGLTEAPAVKAWLTKNGMQVTDENATEAVRQMYGQYFAGGHAATDVVGAGMDPQLGGILSRIPGRAPSNELQSAKNVLMTAAGRAPETSLNPLNVRGFNGKFKTTFGPTAAGDMVGKYTDQLNRLTPFINRLKAGVDPAEAAAAINFAQVDYSTRLVTPHEKLLKRLFPFYTFTKQQAAYVAKELLTNPGGRLGASIRASRLAHNPDEITPDYVAHSASVPLGQLEDGSKRYLTGMGLMHEDTLAFGGSGVQGGLLELASRANPLVKGPLEWATGQSFFQRGPEGGRPLEDLDPTLGRLAANVSGQKNAVRFPGSAAVEAIVGNSPLTRVASTARQLTDTRKGVGIKALNLLTGVRVTDVSPAAEDAVLRERARNVMKEMGAKSFERVYFPKADMEAMPANERKEAERFNALMTLLASDAKKRKLAAKQLVGGK